MAIELPPHGMRLALICPQIAPNTGNIARLCVASGAELHLIRPLGFTLSERNLRRSAMDYWPRLKLTVHDDATAFWKSVGTDRFWLLSSKGELPLWDAPFSAGDWLVFGNETAGLPDDLLARHAGRTIRIPMAAHERCLNLSTAAGIALYEAIRQVSRP